MVTYFITGVVLSKSSSWPCCLLGPIQYWTGCEMLFVKWVLSWQVFDIPFDFEEFIVTPGMIGLRQKKGVSFGDRAFRENEPTPFVKLVYKVR